MRWIGTLTNTCASRYYQPTAPINADTRFPSTGTPPVKTGNEEPDLNIQSDISSSKISSPDTALTAFCQLVTWRIGAQRAMIRYGLSKLHGKICLIKSYVIKNIAD
jgi:hypothetical protein